MKNIWKLMIALALVLCMIATLVACAGDDTNGDAPAGDAPAGDTTPEDPGNDTTGVDGTLTNKGANTDPDFIGQ